MTTGFVALLLTAMVLLFVVVPLWLGRQVGVRSDGGYISAKK
jgi:type IV secretory pathway VirB3-like protein